MRLAPYGYGTAPPLPRIAVVLDAHVFVWRKLDLDVSDMARIKPISLRRSERGQAYGEPRAGDDLEYGAAMRVHSQLVQSRFCSVSSNLLGGSMICLGSNSGGMGEAGDADVLAGYALETVDQLAERGRLRVHVADSLLSPGLDADISVLVGLRPSHLRISTHRVNTLQDQFTEGMSSLAHVHKCRLNGGVVELVVRAHPVLIHLMQRIELGE